MSTMTLFRAATLVVILLLVHCSKASAETNPAPPENTAAPAEKTPPASLPSAKAPSASSPPASSEKTTSEKTNFVLTDYRDSMHDSISEKWLKLGHKDDERTRTSWPLFQFHVNKDGSISDLQLVKSCGDTTADNDALHAVTAAAPFAPPPDGFDQTVTWNLHYENVDFGPFMAVIQKEIKKRWQPPAGNETKKVSVVFQVERGGTFSGVKVTRSSGVAAADNAAMAAVTKVGQFPHLPAGSPKNVDIEFHFDYNVFNHLSAYVEPATSNDKIEDKYLYALQTAIMEKLSKESVRIDSTQIPQKVIINFTADQSGNLADSVFKQSSGNDQFDSVCMKVIVATFPLKQHQQGQAHLKCSFGFPKQIDTGESSSANPNVHAKPGKKSAAIELNNSGVRLMVANRFDASISKLTEALQVDPNYSIAWDNLAIAYNNKALSMPVATAVNAFRRAIFLNSGNLTTQANLKKCLASLHKKAETFEDHIKLAQECQGTNDLIGACAEYQMALASKEDAETTKLLQSLKESAQKELLAHPNPF